MTESVAAREECVWVNVVIPRNISQVHTQTNLKTTERSSFLYELKIVKTISGLIAKSAFLIKMSQVADHFAITFAMIISFLTAYLEKSY